MGLVGFLAAILAGASVGLFAHAALMPRSRTNRQLTTLVGYGFTEFQLEDEVKADQDSIVMSLGRLIAARLGRERVESTRKNLMGAGMYDMEVERWLGYSGLALVLIPALMVWFAITTGAQAPIAIAEIVFGGFAGWAVPQAILSRRARTRLEVIHLRMPEFVDLLVVAVESGMAFGAAVHAAAERVTGPLADELELVIGEQTLGITMSEALMNMSQRADVPSVRQFVRTLVHGERLGISIGALLRTLAEELRKRRRSEIEEQAMKAPVKILFPLVLLIFPALFIILLAPAAIAALEAFS